MNRTISSHPHLVGALGNAVAAYHRGTYEHSARVGSDAQLIGEAIGLDAASLESLGWAGALHDLGKLAVPERVLAKTSTLTPNEWEQVKVHPVVGERLLLSISTDLAPVASAVRAHHERWDGTGYPDGLRGEAIPLLGRIIAVVDVYDALTHERTYRRGRYTPEEARRMLETERGTHFDPSLVPVYLRILDARAVENEAERVSALPDCGVS